ncbi:MAG TPA: metallophosphoesterase family protein [Terriglobales bacterium]|jgi:protein phosphatase|nr:metallophosphoesterase family protein [Terriglobales bacterium]
MKIVITSDLHGNAEALGVIPSDYDQLWVLGDLVNYGPNPREVVEFVRDQASRAVRGNHDHAVACGEDPRCHGRFRELAEATGRFTENHLRPADHEYLGGLPLQLELQVDQTRFWLCHAVPSDPLFGYAPGDSPRWREECERLPADILLVGHTHTPFLKKFGHCLVVNPGSLGQPNNRSGLACYAVWQDGHVSLRQTAYSVETTVEKVDAMPMEPDVRRDLVTLLRTGHLPESALEVKNSVSAGRKPVIR